MQTVTANGARIPALGFGTYGMQGEMLSDIVAGAVRSGFRHIDTAQIYANEADVGLGVMQSGVSRNEIFITTKVWVANYAPQLLRASVDESLRKLRTDHIDLLLLHWPNNSVPLADQIGGLNDVVRVGKVRYIGVSNFNRSLMSQAAQLSDIPLATNQFEYHPYLDQHLLVTAAREAGLAVTAYCAMAIGRVFADPTLKEIAERHRKSVAQVVLRWLVQQDNVIALSRTSNPDRLTDNTAVFDFELSAMDMSSIFDLARPNSRIVNPHGLAPAWD